MSKEQQLQKHFYLVDFAKNHGEMYLEKALEIESYFFRLMLAISVGAIFLSVSFIDKLVSLESSEQTWLLPCSWIFFSLNILWICYSIIYTAHYKDKAAGAMFNFVLTEDYNSLIEKSNKVGDRTWILYFNVAFSVLLFLIASSLIVSFVSINMIY